MTEPSEPTSSYPFTQGVGTVFQFVGVTLFLISMFVCCSTSLLSKDTATHSDLTKIGWRRMGDPIDQPTYSAQRALTILLPATICFGMALAALGLGLQTGRPSTPIWATLLNFAALIFWPIHVAFFISLRWISMSILCTLMSMLSAGMLLLAIGAWREMLQRRPVA